MSGRKCPNQMVVELMVGIMHRTEGGTNVTLFFFCPVPPGIAFVSCRNGRRSSKGNQHRCVHIKQLHLIVVGEEPWYGSRPLH